MVVPMEIEAPLDPEAHDATATSRGFLNLFPMDLSRGCPRWIKFLLPATWVKIQDKTHLMLVIGIFANLVIFLFMVVFPVLSASHGRISGYPIIRAVVAGLFLFCCAPYTFGVVGQYDEKLLVKQKQINREKENLTRSYNDLLSDMDGLLQKSAESASGLAERSFESKRRDFQRFLERAKHRHATLDTGKKTDTNDLLKQFRRFCSNWLKVFEECSIDPVNFPMRVVTVESLNSCTTVAEVAELCLESLRRTEVRFISMQRDRDAQTLRRNKTELRRLTAGGAGRQLALAAPVQTSMSGLPSSFHSASSASLGGGVGGLSTSASAAGAPRDRQSMRLSWISCGRSSCFRFRTSAPLSGFPKQLGLGCCQISLLSSEHARLVAGFGLGAVLMLIQVFVSVHFEEVRPLGIGAIANVVEISLSLLCVGVILVRFEDIDSVQQGEREVKELSRHNQEVEKQRDKMHEFWSSAQNLTELWLYRTVPRLDLYKELHTRLEDAPKEDLLVNICGANNLLDELDSHLGSLEVWRKDGALPVEDKQKFGKAINRLCQEHEFSEILARLEDVVKTDMGFLQALSLRQQSSTTQ